MIIWEIEPTPTKPGKIRICLDPSQTLNKAIQHPNYIIPTLEENFYMPHGMKYMTVISVKEVFQNIPLTVKSPLLTTMFMPWGRYRWTRLPFGISSASEEWQRQIHMVLEGLQVISIADDILVPGCVWWNKNTSQCHTLPGILQRDRTCGPPSGCFKLWFRGHSPTAKHATQWWHLWRFFITTYVIQLQKP